MSKSTIFHSIRKSTLNTSRRTRICFGCRCKIYKNELYGNHQFRYDYKIMIISFCQKCYTEWYLKYNK